MNLAKPRRHNWTKGAMTPLALPRWQRPYRVGSVWAGYYVDSTGQMWNFTRAA